MDHDGSLSLAEFAVAMHCVSAVESSVELPSNVPPQLRDSLLFHVSNRNNLLSSLNKVVFSEPAAKFFHVKPYQVFKAIK